MSLANSLWASVVFWELPLIFLLGVSLADTLSRVTHVETSQSSRCYYGTGMAYQQNWCFTLPCFSLEECVTSEMSPLNNTAKKGGWWLANQGTNLLLVTGSQHLHTVSDRALSNRLDQHIWTLPTCFSCVTFWHSLSLCVVLFTTLLSPGLRRNVFTIPLA